MDYELWVEPDLLERMTPEQAKLAQLMSDISEECWCAGWMHGTEFRLWEAITDPQDHRHWGQDYIDDEMVEHLKRLSGGVRGWVRYEEGVGELFVPLDEWLTIYGASNKPHRRPEVNPKMHGSEK